MTKNEVIERDVFNQWDWDGREIPFDDFVSLMKDAAGEADVPHLKFSGWLDYDDGWKFRVFVQREETDAERDARVREEGAREADRKARAERQEREQYEALRAKYG